MKWVEILRRYANTPGLREDLARACKHLRKTAGSRSADELGAEQAPLPQPQPVADRLTTDEITDLVAAYVAGTTSIELAGKYDVSKGAVLRLLRAHDFKIRQQPMTDDECQEAIVLYQAGESLAAVGRKFGREHTVIRDILIRAGIPRRDSHGRQR